MTENASSIDVVNPFASRFMRTRRAGPFAIVIFGATGDLTARKLVPALFNLYLDGFLPEPFSIVGFARRDWTSESFRNAMSKALDEFSRQGSPDEATKSKFLSHLKYVRGEFDQPEGFERLAATVRKNAIDQQRPLNLLFYLATPPSAFETITRNLNSVNLVSRQADDDNWTRVIVEKPFGHSLESTWQLNGTLHAAFREEQVYRIDHYLGKETVQNILVFRLGNSIFEPLWNRRYIDSIQITVAESIGIGNRAGYFDTAGMLRDMVQSHMMQVFTLIAMEPPAAFDPVAIRDEKAKVLRAVRLPDAEQLGDHVVRAQYTSGLVGGEEAPAYLQEPDVPSESETESYVALRLAVDNWRWSGVPFYLRTGKRLPKRVTDVAIVFKTPPHYIFDQSGCSDLAPNVLRLRIQPHEGISLSLGAKVPGQAVEITPVRMEFDYDTSFGQSSPEAYERLILDAITGDATLFARADEVEQAWRLIDHIRRHWHTLPLEQYAAGSWGPNGAEALVAREDRQWVRL